MEFIEKDFRELKIPKAIPYLQGINESFKLGKINTKDRICCLFSNILHECGDYKWLEEIASGKDYENRKDLGNTEKNDGVKFKGRSAIMITGKANYTALTRWFYENWYDVDFVKNPELLSTPDYATLPAIWFWENNNLEFYADNNDFINVCSIINTGRIQNKKNPHKINGMEDRIKKYEKLDKWCIKNNIK